MQLLWCIGVGQQDTLRKQITSHTDVILELVVWCGNRGKPWLRQRKWIHYLILSISMTEMLRPPRLRVVTFGCRNSLHLFPPFPLLALSSCPPDRWAVHLYTPPTASVFFFLKKRNSLFLFVTRLYNRTRQYTVLQPPAAAPPPSPPQNSSSSSSSSSSSVPVWISSPGHGPAGLYKDRGDLNAIMRAFIPRGCRLVHWHSRGGLGPWTLTIISNCAMKMCVCAQQKTLPFLIWIGGGSD